MNIDCDPLLIVGCFTYFPFALSPLDYVSQFLNDNVVFILQDLYCVLKLKTVNLFLSTAYTGIECDLL